MATRKTTKAKAKAKPKAKPKAAKAKTKPKAKAKAKSASKSDKVSVRIRMYRQGLGDCFLLTFQQKGKQDFKQWVDCGLCRALRTAPNHEAGG